jgi:restriction system protein
MAIPDFQSIMRPLLEHLADGKEHERQETVDVLSKQFQLSEEELAQLLPSGKQQTFANRVAWAKSHLKGAGLLESPRRGVSKITPVGQALLVAHSGPVGMNVLSQYPAYQAFRGTRGPSKGGKPKPPPPSGGDDLTPEEHIELGYEQHRAKLVSEILEKVKESAPDFFERLVVELLVAMGYGGSRADAGRAVGRSGDGGIDGIIKEDKLGLDTIYIQAKRWEGTVSRPEIQKFAGALQGVRARKGIFITSSSYTAEAVAYARNIDNKIVLIDGAELADLMIDYGIGVSRIQSYELKRLDSDYFVADE